MRNLVLLLMVILSISLFSCDGGSKEKTKQVESQSINNTAFSGYSAEDGLITIKLPDGWKNDGNGPNGFKVYAYIMDNTGDIHKDIIDEYAELLDEVKEIKVDGLPTLTKKEKFQQNQEMISRTWLIYNGKDIICVVVRTEMAQWNDSVADNILSGIKINKREENVELPKPFEGKKFIRPESFPEQIVESFNESYATSAVLSVKNMEKCSTVFQALKGLEKENVEYSDAASVLLLDSVATANGLENYEQFIKTVKVSSVAFGLFAAFTEMEKLEKGSESYKMSSTILQSMITQTGTSKEDLKFVYNNWDMCNTFVNNFNTK